MIIKTMFFVCLAFFCYCYAKANDTKRKKNGTSIQSLINTNVGSAYKILWNMSEMPLAEGLSTDSEITVVQNCDGSILVRTNGKVLAISQDIAEKIRVKKIA